jgi:hypothetical protein
MRVKEEKKRCIVRNNYLPSKPGILLITSVELVAYGYAMFLTASITLHLPVPNKLPDLLSVELCSLS